MAAVSKLDYLKKYMSKDSNDKGGKEKKKKKRVKNTRNLTIIDTDIKFKEYAVAENDDSDEFAAEDEKPQVFVDGLTLLSEHLEKNKKDDARQKWAPISENERRKVLVGSLKEESPNLSPKRTYRKRHDSPDLSPKRVRKRHDSPDLSPNMSHKRHDSPERTSKRHDSSDLSPKRSHKRHDSPDLSPKRSNKRHDSPDLSPKRSRKRHDSPDLSPKRSHKRHDSPDLSPQRSNKRHDSPDLSPQRTHKRHDSPDMSPQRSSKRHDSPDLSPKRSRKRHDSPDLSLKRTHKRHVSPDMSPQRSSKRHDSPDLSPKRSRKRHDSPDLSPKRTHKTSPKRSQMSHGSSHLSPKRSHNAGISESRKSSDGRREVKPEIVKAGKKSGLQSAELLREENKHTRLQEDAYFATMDSNVSGKGTETVYRDKSGRKIDQKLERIKKREIEEKKAKEDEKFLKWGKGIQQVDEYAEKLNEDLYEMSKPLARYQDDQDLDQMLKMQDRAGDPMLEFMKKSKAKARDKKEKPRYKGPNPPPNRFNIWPGYRWDGVDRSNGFEKKRFDTIAERKTLASDAYKWSVEDM